MTILSRKQLDQIKQGYDSVASRSWSLNSKTYIDPRFIDIEKSAIFQRSWQFACHIEKLRKPGQYLVVEVGGGSIINIGSISGNSADPSLALYNASKAFVHGLTRSIAVDHGVAGIRCNAICPGWIMTEMADAVFDLAANPEAAKKDALSRHPAGRFGRPEDIANAALWLASDQSSFATGQTFTIDGGLTAASPLQPGLY